MGAPAVDSAVGQRAARAPADPAMALALADLLAYQLNLRERGDLLQARAVTRCIELVRRRARQGVPN